MRICFVNEYFHPDETGGTGTVLSELCRDLKDRYDHVEIDIVTSRNQYRDANRLARHEEWDGIHIFRVTSPKPNGLSTPLRLAANMHFSVSALLKLLRRRRYNAIVVATAPPSGAMVGRWYQAITGVPYVYIVYDLEPDRAVVVHLAKPSHPVVRLFGSAQRKWLHSATKVIALGRCMRDYLVKTYDLPPDKVEIIATGARPETIVPASHDSAFRRRHEITGFTVLYSGNFGRYHDFDTILDASKSLLRTNPDVTIVLTGNGVQRPHIEQRCAQEGLTNVRLFDFVPMEEYADLLATAHVALVTLEAGMEGICVPSKIFGILSAGRPVIAVMSPESEVARILEENNCGRQVPVGDWDRLAYTISDLASRPSDLPDMGRNARQALVNKYATSVIADRFYHALSQIAGGDHVFRLSRGEPATAEGSRSDEGSNERMEALDEVTM